MQTKIASRKDLFKAVLTMLLGLAILGVFIVALGGNRFWEDMDTYSIRFRNVKDLGAGRPVKYAGIDVGRVLDMEVPSNDPGHILVTVGLKQGFSLHQGTRAQVSQKGLVGDNYVSLELQGSPGPVLPPGREIPAADTPGMNELIKTIGEMVNSIKPSLDSIAISIQELFSEENRQLLVAGLKKVPEVLEQMRRILERAELSLVTVESQITALSREARKGITEAKAGVQDARVTLAELRQGVAESRQVLEDVGKQLGATLQGMDQSRAGAYDDWLVTTNTLRGKIGQVSDEITTLSSQLRTDLDFHQERFGLVLDNMAELTEELKRLSRSLRERPWQVLYKPEERP